MKRTLLSIIGLMWIGHSALAQPFVAATPDIDDDTGDNPYELAAGDLDGDGDIDLVMGTYYFVAAGPVQDYITWYSNDGDGNFTAEADISTTLTYIDGLTIANIDNSNGLDVIATSAAQSKVVYFLSDGMGGFGSEIIVDATLSGPGAVTTGDINMDGNIDIATMSYNDNKTVWYSGDGAGNFTSEVDIENGTTDGPYYMALADLDNDSDLDAIVGFVNGDQEVRIYYNQFIESGSTAVTWVQDAVTLDTGNAFLFDVTAGDVNNDGTLNAVVVDLSGKEVQWFEKIKDGASTVNTLTLSSANARPAAAIVTDLDNDGDNDLVVSNGLNAGSSLVYFEGAANTAPTGNGIEIAPASNRQLYDFVVDDFDADGDNDVAALGYNSDTIFWYENQQITLSVNIINNTDFLVYPNPANDHIVLKGNYDKPIKITIANLLGQDVLNTETNVNDRIDISNLTSGMYIININNSDTTFKFMKE
ncbi:MAG: T9SS type A sorting domain-containing protein [Psychroserpens sp.]|uniref:T9SS type A sorting domain-containing protein n=1 Tax=Psychroserpens sp. TaxID=2020870 RepID=UPI003C753116